MDIEEIPKDLVRERKNCDSFYFILFYFIFKVEFHQAAVDVKTKLKVRPADDELLVLYGLFKQGLQGDNTTSN